MALVDHQQGLVALRLVYVGPARAGKTTNLEQLHAHYPARTRGRLTRLDTQQERTNFFEYFAAHVGEIGGFQVRLDFLTSPSSPGRGATRKALLGEADGVVFVADSDPLRQSANLEAWQQLKRTLEGRALSASVPVTLQWNKRDLRRAVEIEALEQRLNPDGAPSQAAIATEAIGVWETQRVIMSLLLGQLRSAIEDGQLSRLRPDERESYFWLRTVARDQQPRAGTHEAAASLGALDDSAARQRQAEPGHQARPSSGIRRGAIRDIACLDAEVRASCEARGVAGAARADATGASLTSHGQIDSETICARMSAAAEPLKKALDLVGLGPLERWCVQSGERGVYVAQRREGILVAASNPRRAR